MIYSFIFFLALFVGIGILAHRKSTGTTLDYLLASKDVKPWLTGFSFFATENSGFMFVGFIGIGYAIGISALWILIGWYIGETLILFSTAKAFRNQTDVVNAHTYSELLGRWSGEDYKYVRWLSALIIIAFLPVYAAAQLSAGGKALNVALGWDLSIGAVIGFLIVIAYCLSGGIRATVWTDAVQALVMFISLFLIVGFGLHEIGGIGALIGALNEIDPALLDMMSGDYKYGILGFFAGWLFAGVGVMGQAHVMVRFMLIKDAESTKKAVWYYAGLVTILSILCMTAALCARVLLPELGDAELGLPTLSSTYLPGILAGVFLAGLFAASISSADSQILSSSAALTRDLFPKDEAKVWWPKVGTLLVGAFALGIVLSGQDNVFKLATFSWALMASGMAPLFFLYIMGKTPTQVHAVLIMIIGMVASYAWEYAGMSGDIYNVLPGLVAGMLSYYLLIPVFKIRSA